MIWTKVDDNDEDNAVPILWPRKVVKECACLTFKLKCGVRNGGPVCLDLFEQVTPNWTIFGPAFSWNRVFTSKNSATLVQTSTMLGRIGLLFHGFWSKPEWENVYFWHGTGILVETEIFQINKALKINISVSYVPPRLQWFPNNAGKLVKDGQGCEMATL